MNTDPSLWSFIANAGPVVKVVMLLLASASIVSWGIIFQRSMLLKKARSGLNEFENQFWSGADLSQLFNGLEGRKQELTGLESIFFSGFNEFLRLRQRGLHFDAVMEGAQRAMRVAHAREHDKLENQLSFLATVGSTSPYVGLFGTVWGIMTSFQALGQVSQATISMVAPGISEALIATAMGLFAAIPAVIAYNRYASVVDRLSNQYHTFLEELTSILHRQGVPENKRMNEA
ncbi:MAG: protein TolQ [Gammaproteobacteria bacterium]|nr:protein TolQ [Gammaproteobacteria bacterium]